MATKTKKRGPHITQNFRVQSGLNHDALIQLAKSEPDAFLQKCDDLIESGELSWKTIRNITRLFHGLADIQVPTNVEVDGYTHAVMASAFPLLSGSLTVAGINEGYEGVATIGEKLVTDAQSNKKISEYAILTSEDTQIDSVEEGKPFPEVGAGEEKVEIRNRRNGRRMSITAEMISENDVAGIADRVNQLGEIAGELIEEQTLRRVTDHDGSASSPAEPYVYRPGGTGTQLYSASANTPSVRTPSGTRVNTNALVDETDLQACRAVLAAMLNTRLRRIANPVTQMQLLVPDAVAGVAQKLLGSEMQPGVENELNNWGPRGSYRPELVSSPKMDDLSTAAWYMGNFRKQFTRKWKLLLENVVLAGDTQAFLESRIAAQFRVAWDVEIGARDIVYVVQNLAATTAPKDE